MALRTAPRRRLMVPRERADAYIAEALLRVKARERLAQQGGTEQIAADPATWMRETLGADLWEKQLEIAEAVRDHRRRRRERRYGDVVAIVL